MKDNILKKEFNKKDVTRLRNLVKGKSSERTGQGIGYTKKEEFHKEGDIWEENGRKWTIKDGIKENITKLDKYKKANVPLFCPSCNQVMNKQLDSNYYRAHGQCLNCTTKFETELKLNGTWEEHKNSTHNKEIDKLIEEYKAFMKEKLNESNDGFITESGEVEKWVGGINKDRAEEALKEGIEYLKSLKKQ
jgi:transcription elongation factor Elf1